MKRCTSLFVLMLLMSVGRIATAQDAYFVYVSPDAIGVNPFLSMGKSGTEAAGERFDAEVATYESTTAASRRENVEAAINEGASLVVLLGFEFNDIINEVASSSPDIDFLIVDQCIEELPANVHCAVFREYEASYLLGIAGAMMSEDNHVGVVGALDIPFMHRFTDGFAEGARSVNSDIQVDVRWVGGQNPFADPVRAKEQAIAIASGGADPILTATSGGDFGVFEAAAEQEFKVFNVDVNLCSEAPGQVIDSVLKKVDNAILAAVERIVAGEDSVVMSLGLAEKGMSTIALEAGDSASGGCLISDQPEVIAAMQAAADGIISGEIKLDDPMFAQ